jgi:hypothetical protein
MTRTPPQPAATGYPAYSQTLPSVPVSACHARQLVTYALHVWALETLAEAATQCVSELVANAVQYSGSRNIRVTASRPSKRWVRIAVTQRKNAPPIQPQPRPDDEHGRGLILINALCDRWGTDDGRATKRFWCEFDVSGDTTPFAQLVPLVTACGQDATEVRR